MKINNINLNFYDSFDEENEETDICPSCGSLLEVEFNPDCEDQNGCGMYVRDNLDEDTSEEIMDIDYDEEDEELEELDFD